MPYYLFAASALALIVIVIFLRYILPITPDILPNFHKINSGLYRGGQPSKKGLLKLKGLGVKTIISLRSNFVLTQREKVMAEKLNMNFISMPLSGFSMPGNKKVKGLMEAITDNENQPVYIHCRSGRDRTGMVVAAYRIIFQRWKPNLAYQEARNFGFRKYYIPLKRFILRGAVQYRGIFPDED